MATERRAGAPGNGSRPDAPRPARPEEAAALRALVAAAYGGYVARIGRPPGPMLDDYGARIARGEAWVLEEAGAILGLLVLEEGADALLLDNVAVAPAAQGRGLGRRLIAFAEAEAARRGHALLRLYTHALMTENRALYRRLGFVETGRAVQAGFDRVLMAKRIG